MRKIKGYNKLWNWFSLSHASWCTLPRVLMHQMPDKWQNKMADLLEEYDATWNFNHEIFKDLEGTRVHVIKNNKLVKTPSWLINYRHPDFKFFNGLKNK